jgi:hypothetical protein
MPEKRMFCRLSAGMLAPIGNVGQELPGYPVTEVSVRWLVENGIDYRSIVAPV